MAEELLEIKQRLNKLYHWLHLEPEEIEHTLSPYEEENYEHTMSQLDDLLKVTERALNQSERPL